MKYLVLFENFKEIMLSDYSIINNQEHFNSREINFFEKITRDNEWDYTELTIDSSIQIGFYKKDGDYFYRILIEKQYDEYYLVSLDLECYDYPDKDTSRYFLLDTYEELVEFLKEVEKFYKHKRLYNIRWIK